MVYGFGCDPTGEEYKVVRIVFSGQDYESEVKIYSSDNSWKRIGTVPYKGYYFTSSGVFLDESLHWLARLDFDCNQLLISFNMNEEFQKTSGSNILRAMSKEEIYYWGRRPKKLGVLGGLLCMLNGDSEYTYAIWVMMNYGEKESWTRLYDHVYDRVSMSINQVHPRPLHISKTGRVLSNSSEGLILFEPEHKEVRKLESPKSSDIRTYVGSLIPLTSVGSPDITRTYATYNKFLGLGGVWEGRVRVYIQVGYLFGLGAVGVGGGLEVDHGVGAWGTVDIEDEDVKAGWAFRDLVERMRLLAIFCCRVERRCLEVP
ncbi:hypothetical protein GIB67_001441 [Kingdonia uniflora]|uniref:F-box associated beta-propeller type 1 domain-containing protein n=1 Tax=Kingdonia uniflora TaxID=39325 RepID=A0A7J7L6M8_9MAGN|nr:hypothetical protein GIB67_001441 [Kingdonia uniflora]